ncbi:siderophore-interacting protein [Aureimonas flava]|uniref:Siderophore-interacting protein n=1 Tax=Aureimonas flava TaxID=2320271 RepID=A0A3A1WQD2_9HYPH|nr:siderophore-interacting protein [Aureimonas flava]RIY03293.1 siderophore-interacting protein [Aureimonas flava]
MDQIEPSAQPTDAGDATPRLCSRLSVPVADREGFLRHFLEHLDEDVEPAVGPDSETRLVIYDCDTRLSFSGETLRVVVEGTEAGRHGVAKGVVAYYVQHILGEACPPLVWAGDGADTRELAHFREMRVVSSQQLSPHMRRVRLAGRDLARFATGGLHVRLLFPPKGRAPVWPHAGPAALPVWPEGEDELVTRVYTIRRIDAPAGHVDIDVVLHDPPGAGCRWSREAQPGELVGMLGPGGGDAGQADDYLFLGDETALPAIARILEEMPANARGQAFIEVGGPAEEQALRHPEGIALRWLHRDGAPAGTTTLLEDAARTAVSPGSPPPFVWAGCEFEAFKAIRRFCRKDLGLRKTQHLVVAYWRRGARQDDDASADDEA